MQQVGGPWGTPLQTSHDRRGVRVGGRLPSSAARSIDHSRESFLHHIGWAEDERTSDLEIAADDASDRMLRGATSRWTVIGLGMR